VGEDWITDDALYSLRANYEFKWATLTSITTYQKQRVNTHTDFTNRFGPLLSSIIGIPNLGVVDHLSLADHKITQEFRATSRSTGKFEWLAGLYFTHEKSVQPEHMTGFTLPNALPVPGLQPLFVDPNSDSYKEYAGYGDLTYHVTSKLKILGGVRVTSDSEDNITPFSGLFNGPPAVAIANTSSRSTTYSVSPSYNIDQHQMVYARVATGFRPGGPTGLTTTSVYAGAPATYGPDTLTNYEVGYKADYPSARMSLELSAFDIEWKKMQVLSEIGGFIITGNAADSRSSGIEFAWTWAPLAGLNFAANADYTHAYLTTDAPGIGGKAGDNLPAVPEFSSYVSGEYDFPVGPSAYAFVGGNFMYEGSRYSNFVTGLPANMSRTVLPAYRTLNLHAGFNYDRVTAEVYMKNVTNTYAFSEISSEANDGFSAPLAAGVIQPRTVGISLSTKF
jgi:outer membrane receptor protein involved in Fe transport